VGGPARGGSPLKPSRFAYHAPATISECVGLLAEHGEDAKPLAGGQSLVPLMNLRLAAPAVLVDLNPIGELAYVFDDGVRLVLGAMTRHRVVAGSERVRAACPLLAHAASHIGYPAIRARGTIGGSLAHADPVSELPCVAVTLDAELVLASADGRRSVAAGEFFRGYFTTAIEPGELLVEVRFPQSGDGAGWGFAELARKAGDYALVAAAAEVTMRHGRVVEARIGLAGAADRPVRAGAAEQLLHGCDAAAAGAVALEHAVAGAVEPGGGRDRAFTGHVAGVLARRAVTDALRRAEAA
jgi:aerobic carbon-monoxide dehydrogenase medium subunit